MSIDVSRLSPWAQRQIAAKLAIKQQAKRKYNNTPAERKTEGATIRFDSQKEARRYDELMLLLKAGKIRNLKLQPQFTLQESYITPEGERVRAVRYVADFSYERATVDLDHAERDDTGLFWKSIPTAWEQVVEDVKSKATKTKSYAIKQKLMQEKFGITVKEI